MWCRIRISSLSLIPRPVNKGPSLSSLPFSFPFNLFFLGTGAFRLVSWMEKSWCINGEQVRSADEEWPEGWHQSQILNFFFLVWQTTAVHYNTIYLTRCLSNLKLINFNGVKFEMYTQALKFEFLLAYILSFLTYGLFVQCN